jgi:putative transposase
MITDPKPSLAPKSASPAEKNPLAFVLESDLANFSLRELLSLLLSSTGAAERKAYLERTTADKPNGFYDRSLQVGNLPLDIRVPRTRSGQFRPTTLPPLYQRGYSEEIQSLVLSLLASGRSIHAAKEALQKMGLSTSPHELEQIATGLIEELDLRNSRPLDPDLFALLLDGKYVEFRDGDRLRPACIYLIVGLRRDGKKQVLTCLARPGRENLEDWKFVLRNLLERGLRRIMLLVQDDFSGLLPITQSLFPQADIQLCTVHMQRNAKSHLPKTENGEFQQRWRTIKASWTLEVAQHQFDDLCQRFAPSSPTFIAELQKKHLHYLAFLKYPEAIRRSFSTTNAVEAVNGQLEIMRRNNGGYFHSQDVLKLKLNLAINSLESGRWRSPGRSICSVLPQLEAMFQSRFENAG